MRKLLILSVGALLLLVGFAQAAPADFTVEKSSAPSLTNGQTLAKGTKIDLPAGSEIELTDRTSGAPVDRVCVGEYHGIVEKCKGAPGCSIVGRILGSCKARGAQSGGLEAGASRGVPTPRE